MSDAAKTPPKRIGRPRKLDNQHSTQVQTRLTDEQVARLQAYLDKSGEQAANFIRRAILAALDKEGC